MLAQTYARRGNFRHDRFEHSTSGNDLRKALDLLEGLTRECPDSLDNQRELGRIYRSLGKLYAATHRLQEAEGAFRQAEKIHTRLVRKYPNAFDFRIALAQSYYQEGYHWWSYYRNRDETERVRSRAMERAEAAFLKAVPLQEQLAREHPLAHSCQIELSKSYGMLSQIYLLTGRPDQQENFLLKALPLQEEAARRNPNEMDYLRTLGVTYAYLGDMLHPTKQAQAQLNRFGQAIGMFEKMLEIDKGNQLAKHFLSEMLRSRAKALARLSRSTEAVADWDRAITIDPHSRDLVGRETAHAYFQAFLGQHAKATEKADAIVLEKLQSWDVLYGLAAAYSLSAAAALKDTKLSSEERVRVADRYSTRAIGVLAWAHSLGLFNDQIHLYSLKKEADLDCLRGRADFQKLVAEVERESKQEGKPSPPAVQK